MAKGNKTNPPKTPPPVPSRKTQSNLGFPRRLRESSSEMVLGTPELLFLILCRLTPRQLCVLRGVSRWWQKSVEDALLWKHKYVEYFPESNGIIRGQCVLAQPPSPKMFFQALVNGMQAAIVQGLEKKDYCSVRKCLDEVPLTFDRLDVDARPFGYVGPFARELLNVGVVALYGDFETEARTLVQLLLECTGDQINSFLLRSEDDHVWIQGYVNGLALLPYINEEGVINAECAGWGGKTYAELREQYPQLLIMKEAAVEVDPSVLSWSANRGLCGLVKALISHKNFTQSALERAVRWAILKEHFEVLPMLVRRLTDDAVIDAILDDIIESDVVDALECFLEPGLWIMTDERAFNFLITALEKQKCDVANGFLSGEYPFVDYQTVINTIVRDDNQAAIEGLFILAFREDRLDILLGLLDSSISIDSRYSQNQTLLHLAARYTISDLPFEYQDEWQSGVDILLARGIDPNVLDDEGNTPLHRAAENGPCVLVEVLLEKGGTPHAVNQAQETPLFGAVRRDAPTAVARLVESGAVVEVSNTTGETPIQIAIADDRPSALTELLKISCEAEPASAEFFKISCGAQPPTKVEEVWFYAGCTGNVEVVERLLAGGIREKMLNYCDESTLENVKPTLLKFLVRKACPSDQDAKLVRLILEADLIQESDRATLHNCLRRPIAKNYPGLLHILAEKDISVWTTGAYNQGEILNETAKAIGELCQSHPETAEVLFLKAARNGETDKVRIWLEHGVDVNACDPQGNTGLYYAVLNRYPETAARLLSHCATSETGIAASVDLLRECDDKAFIGELLQAVFRYYSYTLKDFIKALFTRGFDINSTYKGKRTALHIATLWSPESVFMFSEIEGIDCNPQDSTGNTPLHLATQEDFPEIARWLLAHGAAVDVQNDLGETPLFNAVRKDSECVNDLLSAAASAEVMNVKNENPLTIAMTENSGRLVMKLLGIPEDTIQCHGKRVIGSIEVWDHLVSSNDYERVRKMLKAKRPDGPYIAAIDKPICQKQGEMVRLLIEGGVRVLSPVSSIVPIPVLGLAITHKLFDDCPELVNVFLMAALRDEENRAVRRILEKLHVDFEGEEADGKPLLDCLFEPEKIALLKRFAAVVCRAGRVDILQKLLGRGFNVAETYLAGTTLLHVAAGGGSSQAIPVLVSAGLPVDVRDGAGNTPLHTAVDYLHRYLADGPNQMEIIEVVVLAGADVNALDANEKTAFSLLLSNAMSVVTRYRYTDPQPDVMAALRLLLSRGAEASFNYTENSALSILCYAARKGELTLLAGIVDNLVLPLPAATKVRAAALIAAVGGRQLECVEFLLSRGVDLEAQALITAISVGHAAIMRRLLWAYREREGEDRIARQYLIDTLTVNKSLSLSAAKTLFAEGFDIDFEIDGENPLVYMGNLCQCYEEQGENAAGQISVIRQCYTEHGFPREIPFTTWFERFLDNALRLLLDAGIRPPKGYRNKHILTHIKQGRIYKNNWEIQWDDTVSLQDNIKKHLKDYVRIKGRVSRIWLRRGQDSLDIVPEIDSLTPLEILAILESEREQFTGKKTDSFYRRVCFAIEKIYKHQQRCLSEYLETQASAARVMTPYQHPSLQEAGAAQTAPQNPEVIDLGDSEIVAAGVSEDDGMQTYYDCLNVSRDAEADEVEASYLNLLLTATAEEAVNLHQAFVALSNLMRSEVHEAPRTQRKTHRSSSASSNDGSFEGAAAAMGARGVFAVDTTAPSVNTEPARGTGCQITTVTVVAGHKG